MKIIRKAGKNTIKITRKEWVALGKQQGWLNKTADEFAIYDEPTETIDVASPTETTTVPPPTPKPSKSWYDDPKEDEMGRILKIEKLLERIVKKFQFVAPRFMRAHINVEIEGDEGSKVFTLQYLDPETKKPSEMTGGAVDFLRTFKRLLSKLGLLNIITEKSNQEAVESDVEIDSTKDLIREIRENMRHREDEKRRKDAPPEPTSSVEPTQGV